jgi:hypothetical protein
MLTFIQFLEELATDELTIPASDMERMVSHFGTAVRGMGHLNSEGGLAIPIKVIQNAIARFEGHDLSEAVRELKSDKQLAEMLRLSEASVLIGHITDAYREYFRELMTRYQNSSNPDESNRLRDQLVREVFGS